MKKDLLNNTKKLILTIRDIGKELSICNDSAKVTANRYTKSGSLIRIKRNFYITSQKFKALNESELFQIVNFIEVPSYVSLTTALSYYNITTQQLQNVIESISLKRTKIQIVNNIEFRYYKVKQSFYSGFSNSRSFFIAEPEKAFADTVYLSSLGKYSIDFEALDFKKLNLHKVNSYLKNTNSITIKFWEKLCKHYKI
jgi:predicted transcriptional regulator of viral defense system